MAAAAAPIMTLVILTGLLLFAMLMNDQERAAQLARQIEDLLARFRDTSAEGEAARREAEAALEKYKQKDPKGDDPQPVPLPWNIDGQYRRTESKRDDDDDCDKELKKLRVHQYKDRSKFCGPDEQSHHVVLDKYFTKGRDKGGIRNICPGYNKDTAIAIPVEGGATDPNRRTQHYRITYMQESAARGHYNSYMESHGETRPTYGDSLQEATQQIISHVTQDPKEVACLMKAVKDYFRDKCPGIHTGTQLRLPWTRPADPGPPNTEPTNFTPILTR